MPNDDPLLGHGRQVIVREDWLRLTEELILEPGLPIVDPHHHLWQRGKGSYLLPELLADVLPAAGLPLALAEALEDGSWDEELQAETDAALALTGKDVGTPIIHVQPPGGVAFFGPVISRRPTDDEAVALWDHVVGLASFAGFAELKRSLRELPQLPALGVPADEAGVQEDWHGGSRRQKR